MSNSERSTRLRSSKEGTTTTQKTKLDKFLTSTPRTTSDMSSPNVDNDSPPGEAMTVHTAELKVLISEALKDQLHELLENQKGLKTDIKDLHDKTAQILASVEFNAEQIKANSQGISKMTDEMADMKLDYEKKFLTQELYMRKTNLLVYGIPESENPDKACRQLFSSMGVENSSQMLLVNIHRLPRLSTDPANFNATMPKPIMVKFVQMCDRQAVFQASIKQFKILREKKMSIRSDLPVVLKKLRGKLAKKGFELRKNYSVQTRIRERGIDVFLQFRKDSNSTWRTIDLEEDIRL